MPASLVSPRSELAGVPFFAPRKARKTVSHVAAYAIVALFCLMFDLFLPGRAGLALSSALFLIWSIWLVNEEQKASVLALNPMVCYQAWQTATLGVAPLYTALNGAPGSDVLFEGGRYLAFGVVAYGHALMVAGSWALYAGMKQFQPGEAKGQTTETSSPAVAGLFIAAAVGVLFHWGNEVITPYIGSTMVQLNLLPLAALCMVALNPPRNLRRSGNAQFVVVLLGSLAVLLLNSRRDSKMDLILSFVPLLWLTLIRKNRTTLVFVGLALIALYLLVIAPLVMLIRTTGVRDESGSVSTLSRGSTQGAADTLRANYSSDPIAYLQDQVDATMSRLCDPSAAGMVVTLVQNGGFLWGQGLGYVPSSFMPRILWPSKPFSDRGHYFTASIGGASDASLATTSTGQTAAGELYWNFGWFGVFVGMYLLGAAISGFWWGAAGADPRRGLLEMAAYSGAMLSFVTGTGATAGTAFVGAVAAGIFWRAAIFVRDRVLSDRVRNARGASRSLQVRHTRRTTGPAGGRAHNPCETLATG